MSLFVASMRMVTVAPGAMAMEPLALQLAQASAIMAADDAESIEAQLPCIRTFAERYHIAVPLPQSANATALVQEYRTVTRARFAGAMRPKLDLRLGRVKIEADPAMVRCVDLLPAAAAVGLVSREVALRFFEQAQLAVEERMAAVKVPPRQGATWSFLCCGALGGALGSLALAVGFQHLPWIAASLACGAGIAVVLRRHERAAQRTLDEHARSLPNQELVLRLMHETIAISREQVLHPPRVALWR